ncbi:MAG: tRNA pseudouridine(13) synthase TruD [Pseudomonadota bacterium]
MCARRSIKSFPECSQSPQWPNWHGAPLSHGLLRVNNADFQVTEQLGFVPDGDGPHTWLRVRKTGATTPWVSKLLAAHCGVAVREVGFSGLKDRYAITEQWFSVPIPAADPRLAVGPIDTDVSILECAAARRKLRRGTHRSNTFALVIRDVSFASEALAERIDRLRRYGFPNYFGRQRFGRDCSNLDLAERLANGGRARGPKREFAVSAARSFLFNGFTARRVGEGRLLEWRDGDRAILAGSRSHFEVDLDDPALPERTAAGDIHPSATLWGQDGSSLSGAAAELERASIDALDKRHWRTWLEQSRSASMLRPVRVMAGDLTYLYDAEAACLRLEFTLPVGSFATALLAELVDVTDTSIHNRVSSNT